MGYKIFKIKLTVLYTTSSISFFLCLLAILGVTPFVPWYGSADCQNYTLKQKSNDELISAVTECNYLAIGLFTTEECIGGNCKVKSNSDINFDEMTKRYESFRTSNVTQIQASLTSANSSDTENVAGIGIETDFADMHEIEVAGAVSFPFLLLGFLVLALTGLFCFHHLVSESYHVTFGMALFGTISVFLLLCVACYGGIIGNSDVTDMCSEKVMKSDPCSDIQYDETTEKCDYHETSDLCGFGPGYWLTLLALINSFISIGISYITNPDALEEK